MRKAYRPKTARAQHKRDRVEAKLAAHLAKVAKLKADVSDGTPVPVAAVQGALEGAWTEGAV